MTAAFSAALLGAHEVTTRVEVTDANGAVRLLPVTSGTVEIDATAATRRRCSGITVADPKTYTPANRDSLLAAFTNEIKLYRGVRFANGTTELYSLGVFGIEDVTAHEDRAGLSLTIDSGLDRSSAVRQNQWTNSYPVASGTNLGTAIRNLITDRFAGATFNFTSTSLTTPGLLFGTAADNDPWKDAVSLATAGGFDLYVDPDGVFTMAPLLDPVTAPASWSFGDGQGAYLLGIDKKMTRDRSYSRVVAYSEGTGLTNPLRSDVSVVSARPRTFLYRTSAVLTQGQLDAVAQALLNRYSGVYTNIGFEAVPDPRLDVNTVGQLKRGALYVDGKYVLERLSIGLGVSEPMQATVRGGNG